MVAFAVVGNASRRASSASLCARKRVHNPDTRDSVLRCVSTCDESSHLFARIPANIQMQLRVDGL